MSEILIPSGWNPSALTGSFLNFAEICGGEIWSGGWAPRFERIDGQLMLARARAKFTAMLRARQGLTAPPLQLRRQPIELRRAVVAFRREARSPYCQAAFESYALRLRTARTMRHWFHVPEADRQRYRRRFGKKAARHAAMYHSRALAARALALQSSAS